MEVARRRILLAEDNPADVFLVRAALDRQQQFDFDLLVFSDGEEVVRYIDRFQAGEGNANCPDLLLLDMNMPRYNGEEILMKLRQDAQFKAVPVIMFTSSDSLRDRERAVALGVHHYFRKPSDYDEFMLLGSLVTDVLENSRASAERNSAR